MDCGCAYSSYDGGGCGFYKQKTVKARKKHECCVCLRVIKQNERYETAIGVWDGDFRTFSTCADCLSIRDAFFCGEYAFEFSEDLQQHLDSIEGQVSSACLEALTPAARARVIDMIDELWEEDRS